MLHQSELIGGNYTIGAFRFNTGFAHYTAEQGVNNSMGLRTDKSWLTSASFQPTGQSKFYVGYQVMKGKNAGFNGGGNILNPFGNTSGVTSTADGAKKSIYAGYIYSPDKQTDFYFAVDTFKATGGWVVGDAQGNGNHYGIGQQFKGTLETAIGVRYKS